MSAPTSLKANIRQAWRIALPYFRSEERWVACTLLACVIAGQLVFVGMAVAENYWRNAFYQTLQAKNWPGFVQQFLVYAAIGVGYVLATVYQRYFTQWLTIRWRRWLTARYLDRWLDGPVHYRAMIATGDIDNPDQRVADDIRQFIETTLSLTVGLLGEIVKMFSFVAILWAVSNEIPLHLFGWSTVIPGYLVWAALIYAIVGSAITHWIGRSLIPIDFEQERREADFRFALVRLRENAEVVALLRGEGAEKRELLERFRAIMQNWLRLMARQQWVGLFTGAYRRFSLYFPYFAMAPLYFGGSMQLGSFMQSGSAFNQVRDSFSYFTTSYLDIARLSAIVQRLAQFDATIFAAEQLAGRVQGGDLPIRGGMLAARDLAVATPAGSVIARLDDVSISTGEAVLVVGFSGAGKTSILRSLVGVWPYYTGVVESEATRPMMLPQRAYIPLGTLRHAVVYPLDLAIDETSIRQALADVGLAAFNDELDRSDAWDKRLSEGEKQRLSLARALIFAPDLLLLDEATSALDAPSELALHRLIREKLSASTIVAVSHREGLASLYDRVIRVQSPIQPDGPPQLPEHA